MDTQLDDGIEIPSQEEFLAQRRETTRIPALKHGKKRIRRFRVVRADGVKRTAAIEFAYGGTPYFREVEGHAEDSEWAYPFEGCRVIGNALSQAELDSLPAWIDRERLTAS